MLLFFVSNSEFCFFLCQSLSVAIICVRFFVATLRIYRSYMMYKDKCKQNNKQKSGTPHCVIRIIHTSKSNHDKRRYNLALCIKIQMKIVKTLTKVARFFKSLYCFVFSFPISALSLFNILKLFKRSLCRLEIFCRSIFKNLL